MCFQKHDRVSEDFEIGMPSQAFRGYGWFSNCFFYVERVGVWSEAGARWVL